MDNSNIDSKGLLGSVTITSRSKLFKGVVAISAGIVIVVIFSFIFLTYTNGINTLVQKMANENLQRTGNNISSWLSVKMSTTINTEKAMKSFIEYPENLNNYFMDLLENDPDLADIYFGSVLTPAENGLFLDGLQWEPDSDFDWTTRPWYTEAKKSGQVYLTSPYVDYRSLDGGEEKKVTVISLSIPVYDDRDFLGVLGMDILLETLEDIVLQGAMSESSSLTLIGRDEKFVTVEEGQEENQDKNYFDINPDLTKFRNKIFSNDFIFKNQGQTYFASIGVENTDWVLIATGNLSDFHDNTVIFIILFGVLILMALLVFLLLFRTWASFDQLDEAKKTIDEHNHGLELSIKERTASLKNILDNTGQGFFIFGSDYFIEPEYSRGCQEIIGKDLKGFTVIEALFPGRPEVAKDFTQGFDLFFSGKSRAEIIIDLTEKKTTLNDKIVEVEYKEISEDKILCILTDITLQVELEEKNLLDADRHQKILRALNHKHFFAEYLSEAENLFSNLELYSNITPSESDMEKIQMVLHTFKGNSGFFGFTKTQDIAHESETRIIDSQVFQNNFSYKEITLSLKKVFYREMNVITDTMGESWLEEANAIFIPRDAYSKIVNYVRTKVSGEKKLIHYLEYYRMVKFREIFSRLPFVASATAEKLSKKIQPMIIVGGENRVLPERFYPLAETLIHLVNNIVDHGIELPYEREAVQKRPAGKIELYINYGKSQITLEFKDDGKGINPKEIEYVAKEKGLIPDGQNLTNTELMNLIFDSGFSTKNKASIISGRGIGLSAVKDEITKLGGIIEVQSRLGKGTVFEIMIPVKSRK